MTIGGGSPRSEVDWRWRFLGRCGAPDRARKPSLSLPSLTELEVCQDKLRAWARPTRTFTPSGANVHPPLDELPPLGDLHGRAIEEDPDPHCVAQGGRVRSDGSAAQLGSGGKRGMSAGPRIGDKARVMANADVGSHSLRQCVHRADLLDSALRRDVLTAEWRRLRRRENIVGARRSRQDPPR